MKLVPMQDRIIVKRVDDEPEMKNGILIPDSAKEKPQQGEVLAAGRGTSGLKDGDRILFGKYAGTEIEVQGEKLLILQEEEIFAKVVD